MTDGSHLVSFLQAAEMAGVDKVMMQVYTGTFEKRGIALAFQWLHVWISTI